MSDLIQAVENAKAIARSYQSVIDLVSALGDVASVEQAAAEANAAVSVAVQKKAQAEADLATANQLLSDAQARGNAVMVDAKAGADQLMMETQTKAASILAEAQTKADALAAEQAAVTATYEANLTDLQAQIAQANADYHAAATLLKQVQTQTLVLRQTLGA